MQRSKTRARTSGACVTLFATCARSFEGANGEDRAPCELSVSREKLIQRMYAAKNEYDALIAELDRTKEKGMEKDGEAHPGSPEGEPEEDDSETCYWCVGMGTVESFDEDEPSEKRCAGCGGTGKALVKDECILDGVRCSVDVDGHWLRIQRTVGSSLVPIATLRRNAASDPSPNGWPRALAYYERHCRKEEKDEDQRADTGAGDSRLVHSEQAVQGADGAGTSAPAAGDDSAVIGTRPEANSSAVATSPPAGPVPACCSECADGWTYEDSSDHDGHACNCPRGQEIALNRDLAQLQRILKERTPEQVVEAMSKEVRSAIVHALYAKAFPSWDQSDGVTEELALSLIDQRDQALADIAHHKHVAETAIEREGARELIEALIDAGKDLREVTREHEWPRACRAWDSALRLAAPPLPPVRPDCACLEFWSSHPPECPARRWDEANKRPTWQTIDKLPKVRTRRIVYFGEHGTQTVEPRFANNPHPLWATHFIYAPEGE